MARSGFQLAPFRGGEVDDEWASAWQILALLRPDKGSRPAANLSLEYVIVFMKSST
jgi:hypothetical protein